MASPANEQPRRAAPWDDNPLEARDATRRHQSWAPRDYASSHEARDSLYQHAEPLYARAEPLSEKTFLEMQRNLMQHIQVLEALIGVLLFAIVVVGGIIGLRWWSDSRRSGGRRGSFQPLPPVYHSRQSSDVIVPLHMQSVSTHTLPSHLGPYSPQQTGKSALNAAGYHTTSSAKSLPKTPPSVASIADGTRHRAPASATSTASTSTVRVSGDPFASPAPSSRSLPIPQPLPTPASIPPAYPPSQLAHGNDREEEPAPAPLKPAHDTASLLGDELGPMPSSSTSRNAYATSSSTVPPGKKSARHMSVPRSDFGGSFGTAPTDMLSASGTNTSGTYPTVSNLLARLQNTSHRGLTQYTSGFTEQGWTTLDSLRGVKSTELRDAIRGMSSTDAEFLARSIQQELDWIDESRVRGGMGFRMVLSS